MKKLLMLMGILAISATSVYASPCDDFRCPANPYEHSYSISNLTGVNFFAEKIGNAVIKNSLTKNSKGKYKVNLQSYNTSALKKGIFKSLEIKGTDTETDGIFISSTKFKTICNYNYIEINNKLKTATFQEPFAMAYALQFTEEDLNKTMKSPAYREMIRKINNIGNSYKLFNISSTSIKLEDNKLYYTMNATIPLLKLKQEVTVETGMKLRNGEVVLTDTKIVSDHVKLDLSKLEKVVNYLNPMEFAMKIFDDEYANTKIEEVTIKDNKINLSGILLIEAGIVTEI